MGTLSGFAIIELTGQKIVRRLAVKTGGLIDPFRAGVTQRFNIGPTEC